MALATRFLCGTSVFYIDYVTINKKAFKLPYPIPSPGCIHYKETNEIYFRHEDRNATKSKYKGTGAGQSEKSRL